MLPAGKRRWQRVEDSYEKGWQGAIEEEEDDQLTTDKTRLLNVPSSSTLTRLDVGEAQKGWKEEVLAAGQAQDEHKIPSDSTRRWEKGILVQELSNPDRSKRFDMPNPACSALPIKKPCNHASWQGFKQILKKQFTPPFPFGKGLLPPEEVQHHRPRRFEGAMQRHRSSKVLGASTNLVELRKLDAKIQNGINKSAFVASSKRGRLKENLPYHQNLGTGSSRSSIKLGWQEKSLTNVSKNAELAEACMPWTAKWVGCTSQYFLQTYWLDEASCRKR
ncbi:hypothetical protein GOP47_0021552 [Adiantum capillus-veneris]|uniref:Uncharacterized protein n=1 Tax=Adiantum capillus-veneris TaxID=13818 RepID=A0A9D4U7Z1_ADICA|nr:hypothetical protein GOP47_0021552 [Adiantum capillus-veneris]